MAQAPDIAPASRAGPTPMRRLLPAGPPIGADELVAELGLWDREQGGPADGSRPRVLLNMISSLDGRATIAGRSGPLSTPADRELFHALRLPVDAVLVGAGTVRGERYGPLIPQAARRALRRERGLAEQPLACIVSSSLALDPGIGLLADPDSRVILVTGSVGELEPVAAEVRYIRADTVDGLDLTGALRALRETFGVRTVLCEGGPHLAGELLRAGLLDELLLSLAPVLAGASPDAAELGILAGSALEPAVGLELLGVLESESALFLRYGVVAPERVSRETISSSSLAR